MSSQCSAALPPPIVDRVSGKTFIPIPAPPFISARTSDDPMQTSYVYVETKSSSFQRFFTPERSGTQCSKRPLSHWINGIRRSLPPPNHVPWTSQIEKEGETAWRVKAIPPSPAIEHRPRIADLADVSDTISSSDLPSFASSSSILRASLPSMSSFGSSECTVPDFLVAKAMATSTHSGTLRHDNKDRITQSSEAPCIKEEALKTPLVLRKVDDSSTLVDADLPQEAVATTKGELNDVDRYLFTELNKIDSTLHRSELQNEKLEPPLLIVSTSHAAMPLSLESTADIHRASSIAQRRGRTAPGPLMLNQQSVSIELDYPSVPTAFRGTPAYETLDFPMPPSTILRPRPNAPEFSVEQMIASLRAQIESLEFDPMSLQSLVNQAEAMEWLENELQQCEEEEAPSKAKRRSAERQDKTVKPLQYVAKSRARSATVSTRGCKSSALDGLLKGDAPDGPTGSKPRLGIRRATISTTSDSAKKVTFSVGPPMTIPYEIFGGKNTESRTGASPDARHGSPVKRKPPPPLPSPTITTSSGLLTPPPLKFGRSKRRTLYGPPKEPLPPLPTQARRRASDAVQTASTKSTQADAFHRVRSSLDDHRLSRKPKHQMALVNSRFFDENALSPDKVGKKTPKAKSKGRVLPFQNMLNRLRS